MISNSKYKLSKHILALFVTLVLLICFSANANAKTVSPKYFDSQTLSQFSGVTSPETLGYSHIVINLETEAVIFDKRSGDHVFPAATVKLMTAILVYEEIPDRSVEITIGSIVNRSTGKKIGIKEGDVYTADDLFHALLLTGANDVALVFAEYIGGSVDGFVDMMNQKAYKIGARDTHYENPTGIHSNEMVTTAKDTALIASYAYYINDITEITSLTNHYIAPKNRENATTVLYNRNNFVSRSNGVTEYYYRGASGLCSGSTEQAGNCLVTTASKNGLTYLCVVMCAPITGGKINSYTDAKALLDSCFTDFSNTQVVNTGGIVCEVPINLAANIDHVNLYPESTLEALLPSALDPKEDLTFEKVIYGETFDAPISKGERFGELIIKYKEDYTIGKVFLVSDANYERSALLYFLNRVEKFLASKFFIVSAISAVILLTLYFIFAIKTSKKRRLF